MHGGLKRYFLTGIFVLLPLAASALVVYWLFSLLDNWATPLSHRFFGHAIPGLGFIVSLLFILLTGVLSSNVIGKWFLGIVDHVGMDMPVFRTVYNTSKQVMQIFSPEAQNAFHSVVFVENPRTGSLSIGFVTHEMEVDLQNDKGKRVAVYVPTNHLYFGDIFLYKPEQVHVTGLSIQEGIQSIISAGAILPAQLKTDSYHGKS